MRLRSSCLLFVCLAGVLHGADLGSPVPIPARVEARPTLEREAAAALAPACPCGGRCDCAAGQCPACPVQASPAPAAVKTYRQVWMRGMGWVWMAQSSPYSLGGCPGGVCTGR
jgi:hypothetical protein